MLSSNQPVGNCSSHLCELCHRAIHAIVLLNHKMIAPLAKFIDWSALQMAYVVAPLRHAPESKWRLAEALEFLNGPDFIPAASDPARIEFDGRRHFKFPTPRPSEDEENNIVYGRLYRCAERWQERPVIILLDGSPCRRLSHRVSMDCPPVQSGRIQCGPIRRSLPASTPSAPTL